MITISDLPRSAAADAKRLTGYPIVTAALDSADRQTGTGYGC
jgi:hypothetical protein